MPEIITVMVALMEAESGLAGSGFGPEVLTGHSSKQARSQPITRVYCRVCVGGGKEIEWECGRMDIDKGKSPGPSHRLDLATTASLLD